MNFQTKLHSRKSAKIVKMIKNKPSKLALGIALLITGIILLSNSREGTVISSSTFEQEPVITQGFTESDNQNLPSPKRIIIPSLKINLDIDISKIIGGYWEVFNDKAGWGEGSGFPGQPGNQVIFAHAKNNLFQPLRLIEVGAEVYILTETDWYSYKVEEIKEVNPNQTEVIEPTDDEILTLYTCSGYKDSKRLIVIAKPLNRS